MPPRIILDCDPGHDDAIAMLLAHGNPDIELLAVTTVAGNQTLEKVTRNALAIAHVAGITHVPVAAGCARPLIRTLRTAADIHGESGLDGPSLPDSALELDERHAVDLIIDTVMKHDAGTVTLVPTGPLTNIALAVRKEPRIADRIREVVLMGGGYHAGNQTAAAEFNIFVDPEAAHIVFNETWPLTMVGLDLTHQALATDDVTSRTAALGTGPARFVNELLGFYAAHQHAPEANFPPVHDPCAVARVIDPSVMTTRRAPLDVELSGSLTLGMTVADFRIPPPVDCTTSVAVDLDTERFWDLVIDAIGRIGEGGL
jgi:purine nucleosidase